MSTHGLRICTCLLPTTTPSVRGVTAPPAAGPGHTPATTRRLLVVEDDRLIADAVVRRLTAEGYDVDVAYDGLTAVEAASRTTYDAVVLDLMLAGLDGHEVCRRIQSPQPVPVLMLTARAEEADRIAGLAVGADDYMTKPFSPRELVARVAALLRRVDRAGALAAGTPVEHERFELADLVLDGATRRTYVAGREVHLTRTEFDLLRALLRRCGSVVGRQDLLVEVWDWAPSGVSAAAAGGAGRAVDSHVKSLRRKLGPDVIRTVHGVGYSVDAGYLGRRAPS